MVQVQPLQEGSRAARLVVNGLAAAVGDLGWACAARLAMSLTGAAAGVVTARLD